MSVKNFKDMSKILQENIELVAAITNIIKNPPRIFPLEASLSQFGSTGQYSVKLDSSINLSDKYQIELRGINFRTEKSFGMMLTSSCVEQNKCFLENEEGYQHPKLLVIYGENGKNIKNPTTLRFDCICPLPPTLTFNLIIIDEETDFKISDIKDSLLSFNLIDKN